MTLDQLLDALKSSEGFMENVTAWKAIPKKRRLFPIF